MPKPTLNPAPTTPTQLSRRQFTGWIGKAAIASTFGMPAFVRARDLNGRLDVAVIGCGGRGGGNLADVAATENIVLLCDVFAPAVEAAARKHPKARKMADLRRVFDHEKEFDAVVVSTCEHTHAFATLPALKLRKHVYCEKPLSYNIWEARVIRQAAAKANVATQMGTQIHATDNYRRVVELVQSGAIGPVAEVHVWVGRAWGLQSPEAAKRHGDIVQIQDRPSGSSPIPAGLDWDLWLGPAPARPFHQVYFPGPKWYRWWDFGNGTMSDLGSHWNDLPFWALRLQAPLTVEASGPPPHPELAPASMQATYEYGPRGDMPPVRLTWYQGENKPELWKQKAIPQWDSGVLFVGTQGRMLLADYGKRMLLPEKQFEGFTPPDPWIPKSLGHHAEWIHACKTGAGTTCNFDTPDGSPRPITSATSPSAWDASWSGIPNTSAPPMPPKPTGSSAGAIAPDGNSPDRHHPRTPMPPLPHPLLGQLSRRQLLARAGAGAGLLGLATLLREQGLGLRAAESLNPLAARPSHFPAKAKSVIWLFMNGGPSQVDTWDYKPELIRRDGKELAGFDKTTGFFTESVGPLMKSPFEWARHGQSGTWVSDLFPHMAKHVDKMAFIHSCHTNSNNHSPALFMINTGSTRMGWPCVGSWVTYGLGSVSRDLPAFVVMSDPLDRGLPKGHALNWGAGFLPSVYQGTWLRPKGEPIENLKPPADQLPGTQRRQLDLLAQLNQHHLAQSPIESELSARIESFELAYRMQSAAPEAFELNKEPESVRSLYGIDQKHCSHFASQCLIARRMVERGVRFVQIYSGGMENQRSWDGHEDIVGNHRGFARESDQPIAALLQDLQQRGLLDSTLVIWGGEFGRLPISQKGKNPGRDHNPHAFTYWLAGGGVKAGVHHGATDELGYKAADDRVSVNDLHATILHLLGFDHERLTFFSNGRQFRLTDVAGEVVRSIIA